MKVYHVADSLGEPLAARRAGHSVVMGVDELVPIREIDDPAGRHSNCPACMEELAQRRGGTLRRPVPPVSDGELYPGEPV